MFYLQRLRSIIRRGTARAGIRRRGGNGRRSASIDKRPLTGTNAVILSRAVECSSSTRRGWELAAVAILQTRVPVNSSIGHGLSGVVTVIPGASGQPRASAD